MSKLIFNFYSHLDNNHHKLKWDLNNCLNIIDLINTNPDFNSFYPVVKVVEKKENQCGFQMVTINEIDKNLTMWVYIITIDGQIVKSGKSRTPLYKRAYRSGIEDTWIRSNKGMANYLNAQAFRQALKTNKEILFYAYKTPEIKKTITFLNNTKELLFDACEVYEELLNNKIIYLNKGRLYGDGVLYRSLDFIKKIEL